MAGIFAKIHFPGVFQFGFTSTTNYYLICITVFMHLQYELLRTVTSQERDLHIHIKVSWYLLIFGILGPNISVLRLNPDLH